MISSGSDVAGIRGWIGKKSAGLGRDSAASGRSLPSVSKQAWTRSSRPRRPPAPGRPHPPSRTSAAGAWPACGNTPGPDESAARNDDQASQPPPSPRSARPAGKRLVLPGALKLLLEVGKSLPADWQRPRTLPFTLTTGSAQSNRQKDRDCCNYGRSSVVLVT